MAVDLLTPSRVYIPMVSKPQGSTDTLTGRWARIDGNGLVQTPGTQRLGLALIIEGKLLHVGGPTDFSSGVSTKSETFPSALATAQVALAFGVFRYKVGSEGVDVSDSAAIIPGAKLTSDSLGRLVATGATDQLTIGVVESVEKDGSNNVTSVVVRTTGK